MRSLEIEKIKSSEPSTADKPSTSSSKPSTSSSKPSTSSDPISSRKVITRSQTLGQVGMLENKDVLQVPYYQDCGDKIRLSQGYDLDGNKETEKLNVNLERKKSVLASD